MQSLFYIFLYDNRFLILQKSMREVSVAQLKNNYKERAVKQQV